MTLSDQSAEVVSRGGALAASSGKPVRIELARRWAIRLAPIALVAIGAALRISQFKQSLVWDEMWSYVGATRPSLGQVLDFVHSDEEITPPLFTIFAWLSGKLGDPTVWVRLPSLLAGIATIPLVYALGMRTLGRRTALAGAALAALSPFLAWYSIEVRAYALAVAFVVSSTLCLLIALERGQTRWWAGYAVFSCAAMYTHYTAAYVLIAQLAWTLWFHRDATGRAIVANIAAAVAYLPWVPGLRQDLHSPSQGIIGVIAPLNPHNVVDFTARFAVGHPAVGLHGFWGTWAEVVLACGGLAAIAGLGIRLWRERKRPWHCERFEALVLLVMLAVAAPVGIALASAVGDDMFLPRNLATSAPAVLLVIAALITAGPLTFRIVSVTLVLGAFAYGAIMTTEPAWQRPAYRSAGAFIDRTAAPRDVVLNVIGLGPRNSPVTRTLDINLHRRHTVVDQQTPSDARRALRKAAGGRLIMAGNPFFVAGVRSLLGLAQATPVQERDFKGLLPMTVQAFAISSAAQGSRGATGG